MARTVSKSQLKARMLEYFREVERTGNEIIVTSYGRPVLRVVPFEQARCPDEVFADLRGRVRLPADEVLNEPLPHDAFADSDLGDLVS